MEQVNVALEHKPTEEELWKTFRMEPTKNCYFNVCGGGARQSMYNLFAMCVRLSNNTVSPTMITHQATQTPRKIDKSLPHIPNEIWYIIFSYLRAIDF